MISSGNNSSGNIHSVRDFATSDDPAVQAQLHRLAALSLPQGRFGLETIQSLLARLDHPHHHLPPVFHVAGTNGKGSTCAYLTAMLQAAGLRVHAATKPHLVRYNERIRLADKLIDDACLADMLKRVLDAGEDLAPSFFEVTTAASFLAFAEVSADACVIETGLGGRLDATNVLIHPAACGIASLGIDHEAFLLREEAGTPLAPLARIAFEKAAIAKPEAPLVTQNYPHEAEAEVIAAAQRAQTALAMRGRDWWAQTDDGAISYRDVHGALRLPLPLLAGAHQSDNAALAVAMLRHQNRIMISGDAMATGILAARWPARLQLLAPGPLAALAPGRKLWLDGGHNLDAGTVIARHFAPYAAQHGPIHLILGMLANKDPAAIVAPLLPSLRSICVVPIPGHEGHTVENYAAHDTPIRAFASVHDALTALDQEGDVLIAGSLYLAGEVLRQNEEWPT